MDCEIEKKLAVHRKKWSLWNQQQSDAYQKVFWSDRPDRKPVEGVDYPYSPNHWWEQVQGHIA